MTREIEQLHRLEETTLTSDLAQGYALKRLTELLAMFLEKPGARRTYKGRLVGCVLGGYLSLRRLVVQRTRLTDDTQEKLLELLEEMTTGTDILLASLVCTRDPNMFFNGDESTLMQFSPFSHSMHFHALNNTSVCR